MKKILTLAVAVILAGAGATVLAQQKQAAGGEGAASTACAYNFVSGAGPSLLRWCVSAEGNIALLESPAGFEHIRVATILEGYALCNGTSIIAYDVAFDASGFGAPILVAGPSGSGVTIRRFTTTGSFQVDQQFSRDNKENDISIKMTIKNLGPTVGDVRIARIVDWDNDNSVGGDQQDHSDRGVWAREIHGMTLSNITFKKPSDAALAGFGPSCSPVSVATPTLSDVTSVVTSRLGPLNNGKAAATTFVYRHQ